MTIEVALLISGISLAFGIFSGISNMKRNQKSDDKNEASQLTTVIVKLENIGTGITEIKSEMTNVKNDLKETRERIIKVEESSKQAHKRLDTFESYKRHGESNEEYKKEKQVFKVHSCSSDHIKYTFHCCCSLCIFKSWQ